MDKRKINIITISSAIGLIAIVYYFNPMYFVSQGFGSLDSELKHLVMTVVVSGLAGSLFAFRNKAKGELFEQFEAVELLILIVIPCVSAFTFIMQDPSNYFLAVSVYVAGVMLWFFIVITKHKPETESKKEKVFTVKVSYVSAVLLAFGFFALWLANQQQQWMSQMP
ncbi:MAG: hypothetical protein ACW9W4_09120 [Candidatus Nitrosopumilus sp. bin_7KS]